MFFRVVFKQKLVLIRGELRLSLEPSPCPPPPRSVKCLSSRSWVQENGSGQAPCSGVSFLASSCPQPEGKQPQRIMVPKLMFSKAQRSALGVSRIWVLNEVFRGVPHRQRVQYLHPGTGRVQAFSCRWRLEWQSGQRPLWPALP